MFNKGFGFDLEVLLSTLLLALELNTYKYIGFKSLTNPHPKRGYANRTQFKQLYHNSKQSSILL